MNLIRGLSSCSWTLMITIILLPISDAELKTDSGISITNTSQYQCVVRPANDHDYRNGGLQIVDRGKGIARGTFLLDPNAKHYKILLHWINDTSKERCNNKTRFSTYMDLKLTLSKCLQRTDKRCSEHYCKKVVEVNFRYITSGCYNFEVVMGKRVTHDSFTVLETDFLFSKLKNPNCGGSYQSKIFNLSLRADMENMILDDTARLKVCFLESRNESLCTSQNMFFISMKNATYIKHQKQKHSYHMGSNSLLIKFVNISHNVSNIFLIMENDIRCSNSENLFYQTFCRLVINLDKDCKEIQTIASPHFQEVRNDFYGVLLPLLILPLILITSLVIAKRMFFKNSSQDSDLDSMKENNKYAHNGDGMNIQYIEDHSQDEMVKNRELLGNKTVNKIILAYSQDCQEFMDVMKAFRIFLRDVMKFEVFDCFDSDLFALTALDKYGWIDKLIRCQDTGVILVETPLTVIIDEIITKRRVHVKYINPTMFSDVFIYIMKQIRNSNTSSYEKMAVIRFEDYTDEQFIFLDNKFVRFSIPTNLQELFRHFSRRHESPAYSESCVEMKCLKSSLAKLNELRTKNTNHLQSIIIL